MTHEDRYSSLFGAEVWGKEIKKSINQEINQSRNNQSTHQYLPTNEKQSTKQPTNKSTIKEIDQPNVVSTNQILNQPTI